MDMWVVFQKAAEIYGLPFALFLALLVWVLWTNNQRETRYMEREDKYIEVIDKLSDGFDGVKNELIVIKTHMKLHD